MVVYLAAVQRVVTINARESAAPQAFPAASSIDPADGRPIPYASGSTNDLRSQSVPGTLLSWDVAVHHSGR